MQPELFIPLEIVRPVRFTETDVHIPDKFTRSANVNHRGLACPADLLNFSYGTAGFRSREDFMPFIAYRTGIYAGYRAREIQKTIGLMITASHNPYTDNGIKLVDPMGEMLDVSLEGRITELINMPDEDFVNEVRKMEVETPAPIKNVYVHLGWDTRPSSLYLSVAASNGIEQAGVTFVTNGEVTTPQLHYKVRATNDPSYGPVSSFTARFTEAVDLFYENTKVDKHVHYLPKVYVDCANGVGAVWVGLYTCKVKNSVLEVEMCNHNTLKHETLNKSCGADFVKIECRMPAGLEFVPNEGRCCSLDGDADRLIYYYRKNHDDFRLLDGDHIAALFADFILRQLVELGLVDQFKFGVIQTAYANGNSTKFFTEKLKCEVRCVKTGIKHLQKAAQEYDIAVYFESNGHGTVSQSDNFRNHIQKLHLDRLERKTSSKLDDNVAATRLYAFFRIINECVGDGIADMLAVEQILRYYDWSIEDWENNTYMNKHCVQKKVPISNRDLYKTQEDSETRLVEPPTLQNQIDDLVSGFPNSRAFVRPSGTENILRIYAEADELHDAAEISSTIQDLIQQSGAVDV